MLNNRVQMMKAAGNPEQQQRQQQQQLLPLQNSSSQPPAADARVAPPQEEQASETSEAEWLADLIDVRSQDTKSDQLQLQALVYAKQHPEFVRELEAAKKSLEAATGTSRRQQPAPISQQPAKISLQLPNAQQLGQQFDSILNTHQDVASSSARPDYKMVRLAQGVLQVEDPATLEPVVLDWVREDRHQQRRRARGQPTRQLRLKARQTETDEWSDDDGTYQTLHQAMLNWDCARQVGKQPLPRSAPRGWLTTSRKHKQQTTTSGTAGKATVAIPSAWLSTTDITGPVSPPDKSIGQWHGGVYERLSSAKWQLPWFR